MVQSIVLAYERLDMETFAGSGFNGRYEPTTSPASKEYISRMGDWGKRVYYEIIEPESENSDPSHSRENLFFSRTEKAAGLFVRKELHELLPDEQYYYPINIISRSIYLDFTSHISVNPRVLEDARNFRARIIFSFPFEGDMSVSKERFRKLIMQLNVPKESVALFHGDFNTDNFKDEPYLYFPVSTFPWWLAGEKWKPLVDYVPTKLYTCHNRQLRMSRIYTVGMLYRYGLINDGFVSFGKSSVDIHRMNAGFYNNELKENEIVFLNNFMGTSPDGKNLAIDNPANQVTESEYENSFLTIVNETEVGRDTITFFSEKTFKPLLMGHPFLFLGGYKQLAKLKEFGYKTFDRWWDESYDDLPNWRDRVDAVLEILRALKNKSTEELMSIRKEMEPTLMYNQQLFSSTTLDTIYWAHLPTMKVLSDWDW